jgi:hypothetical protein
MMREDVKEDVLYEARRGNRIVIDGKTVWQGLGNRAGLHSFANDVLWEKWTKSGARFEKKLDKVKAGSRVEIQRFANETRDRGRWVVAKLYKV